MEYRQAHSALLTHAQPPKLTLLPLVTANLVL